MILVDPPRWPAHGTVFSHLVSDASLIELHAMAAAIGLNPRAFDHDHYDLPQRLYGAAVAAGAVRCRPDLVKLLLASGLRCGRRRRRRTRAVARSLLPEHWARLGLGSGVFGELVARWSSRIGTTTMSGTWPRPSWRSTRWVTNRRRRRVR